MVAQQSSKLRSEAPSAQVTRNLGPRCRIKPEPSRPLRDTAVNAEPNVQQRAHGGRVAG